MKTHGLVLLAAAGLILAARSPAGAAELQSATVAAFDRYVRLTEARMGTAVDGAAPFLWLDRLDAAERTDVLRRLKAGEVVIRTLETRDRGARIDIPSGLGHHWIGTVFIPGSTLDRTIAMVRDYDRYAEVYRPAVRKSKLITREGDRYKVYLQLFTKRVLSVVLNTEYDVRYVNPKPGRTHVRSYATRIAEVEEAGTPQEREKPVGRDNGFLWRFNNYCSFEERDGGTYMQCESVSLSRDVPTGLGWLIRPFVTAVPRDSLTFTLQAARRHLATDRSPAAFTGTGHDISARPSRPSRPEP